MLELEIDIFEELRTKPQWRVAQFKLAPSRREWKISLAVGEYPDLHKCSGSDGIDSRGKCDFKCFREYVELVGLVFPHDLRSVLDEVHPTLIKGFQHAGHPDGHAVQHVCDGVRRWITQASHAKVDCGEEIRYYTDLLWN